MRKMFRRLWRGLPAAGKAFAAIVAVAAAAASIVGVLYEIGVFAGERAPRFCSIRGLNDAGYLNAVITGTGPRVVAIGVFIVDDNRWYFKPVEREGNAWKVDNPRHQWEVGRPHDPPDTSFQFAMLKRVASGRIPAEAAGVKAIPRAFKAVGDAVPLTKRDLLRGGLANDCST